VRLREILGQERARVVASAFGMVVDPRSPSP
jgi:hypothetical protein